MSIIARSHSLQIERLACERTGMNDLCSERSDRDLWRASQIDWMWSDEREWTDFAVSRTANEDQCRSSSRVHDKENSPSFLSRLGMTLNYNSRFRRKAVDETPANS